MMVSAAIRDFPISCDAPTVGITAVTHDSRRVTPGCLFAALPGKTHDGRRFISEAVERGAVAILAQGARPPGIDAAWLSVEEPRRWLGPLSARIYGHPDREMTTVGVTGTNGKTTVTNLISALLEAAGTPCARLGTLGHSFRGAHWASQRTTPEAPDLFAALREMRERGARAAVMEVSSHALELHRVRGVHFDIAVFTNLTRDHLDFHRDMEQYYAAKRILFESLDEGARSVVNTDDRFGRRLVADLGNALTFGAGGDVEIVEAKLDAQGIEAVLATPRGRIELSSQLRGRFNLENIAAAVAAGEALELSHEAVAQGVASTSPLDGRLEPVDCGQPFQVYIDYAHSEQALTSALVSVREFSPRRLIVVFGCGGDRDPGKREPMGRAAGRLADLAIITSDNPRSEDPSAIIAAVERGVRAAGARDYLVVPNRREAIRTALAQADEDSVVLVAGKGHETEQLLGNTAVHFSDREEVMAALEERRGGRDAG